MLPAVGRLLTRSLPAAAAVGAVGVVAAAVHVAGGSVVGTWLGGTIREAAQAVEMVAAAGDAVAVTAQAVTTTTTTEGAAPE